MYVKEAPHCSRRPAQIFTLCTCLRFKLMVQSVYVTEASDSVSSQLEGHWPFRATSNQTQTSLSSFPTHFSGASIEKERHSERVLRLQTCEHVTMVAKWWASEAPRQPLSSSGWRIGMVGPNHQRVIHLFGNAEIRRDLVFLLIRDNTDL